MKYTYNKKTGEIEKVLEKKKIKLKIKINF
jgi:hypothetical protein